MWSEVCDIFEGKNEDVKFLLTIKKELKDMQLFSDEDGEVKLIKVSANCKGELMFLIEDIDECRFWVGLDDLYLKDRDISDYITLEKV